MSESRAIVKPFLSAGRLALTRPRLGSRTKHNKRSLFGSNLNTYFGNLRLLCTSVNFKLDTKSISCNLYLTPPVECTLPCMSPSSSTTQYGTSLPVAPTWTISVSSHHGTGDHLAANRENGHTSKVVSGGSIYIPCGESKSRKRQKTVRSPVGKYLVQVSTWASAR